MALKLYYNMLSQPGRALYIFLKQCKIPFENHKVNLLKGEHITLEYEKIHPFKKVPAIEHNGFKLIESVAILRYICREFNVDDHWYPSSSKAQAKVDEYLEWYHLNTRLSCYRYFQVEFLLPMLTGTPANPKQVAKLKSQMIETLDLLENVWLKDKPFLTGDQISIADILGACEVEQIRMTGFQLQEGRPHLTTWLDRVATETSPFYEEAHKIANDIIKNHFGGPPSNRSML